MFCNEGLEDFLGVGAAVDEADAAEEEAAGAGDFDFFTGVFLVLADGFDTEGEEREGDREEDGKEEVVVVETADDDEEEVERNFFATMLVREKIGWRWNTQSENLLPFSLTKQLKI
jgi:hypothetical protein